MTQIVSLLFFIYSILMMSACSTLTRIQYFTPSHQNAIPERRANLDGLSLSGPPIAQQINLNFAKLTTGVSSGQLIDGQKTYSFGPVWFPVIPTLFNWFIPYKKIGPNVEISLVFWDIKDDINWEPNKSFVKTSGGLPIAPSRVESQNKKTIMPNESLKIRKTWTSWEISLQYSFPKTTNEFTLYINGLSLDGKEIEEIPVNFKYSKAWIMGFIP